MLRWAREWMEPPSLEEASLFEAILDLNLQRVPRLDRQQIQLMRMPTNQCHANVRWYVHNDPTGQTSQATGWLVQWPDFTLHSVLRRNGEYMCITPTPFDDDSIDFIPDAFIEWREAGDVLCPFRNGQPIPLHVRRFPEFTIARSQFVIERLESGMNPYLAIELPQDEFDKMIVEHIPNEARPERLRR